MCRMQHSQDATTLSGTKLCRPSVRVRMCVQLVNAASNDKTVHGLKELMWLKFQSCSSNPFCAVATMLSIQTRATSCHLANPLSPVEAHLQKGCKPSGQVLKGQDVFFYPFTHNTQLPFCMYNKPGVAKCAIALQMPRTRDLIGCQQLMCILIPTMLHAMTDCLLLVYTCAVCAVLLHCRETSHCI